jgi:hypothetical protein
MDSSIFDSELLKECTWVHGSLIIRVLTLLLLIGVLVCLIKRKSEDTTLVLELTSGGSCATLLPIISFPLCPSYWDVQPPVTIHNLKLEKFPFGDLLLDCSGFKVTNKLPKQSIKVKTSLKVGLLNYLKIKRIINQP